LPLWLYWVLLGLLAGSLAKFLVPGRDPSGCIVTIVLGIAGAFIGGLLGSALGWGHVAAGELDFRSLGIATIGAIVVLLVGRVLRRLR
jgi:uncharacterized membrane protein YeaQ/YmgE (transglycosylase-associated protein family)